MEKLSGILPNSPRVKSVDLSDAKPRRPGAPSFGVPVGDSTKDRVSISSSGVADATKDLLTYRNPKDARGAKIAEDISRKFFETRLKKDDLITPKSAVIAGEPAQKMVDKPVERPDERSLEVPLEDEEMLNPALVPERLLAAEAPLKQAVQ